ncbi:hypothetical protein fh0823_00990 [Francisella halioticida]|nr:hypothetical protein fh0823_00990 [Francisella halioticida]
MIADKSSPILAKPKTALSSFLRSIMLKCSALANNKNDNIPPKTVVLKSKLDNATIRKFVSFKNDAHSAEKVIERIVKPMALGNFKNLVLM